jgi:ribosomal protein S21
MKRHSYYEKPPERKRRQFRKSVRKLEKQREEQGAV